MLEKNSPWPMTRPFIAELFPRLLFQPITFGLHAVKQCNISDSCAFLARNVSGCKVVCLRWYTHEVLRLGTFPPLPFLPDSLRKNKMKIQIEWGCPAFSSIDWRCVVYPAVLLRLNRSPHFMNVFLPYFLDMFTSWTVNFKGWSLFSMADCNCLQFECPKRWTQKQINKHGTMDATL